MFQFLNVKILSIFNSTYQTLALCSNSSLEYLFPTSSNTVSIVFCSVKSFFDHHDCIFEEQRERGVSTGCFIVKLIIKMDRYVFKAVESNKDQCFSQFGFYYIQDQILLISEVNLSQITNTFRTPCTTTISTILHVRTCSISFGEKRSLTKVIQENT